MPTVADIRRFIRDFIDTHHLADDDTDEVEPTLNVSVHNNRATMSLTCDKATAAIIARHIDSQAEHNQCGAGEALIQLILDNTYTKVAINTFTTAAATNPDHNDGSGTGAAGTADTKVYFPGYGWSRITNLENIDTGPDPRKVDTSGVNYATLASIAEVSASKTSGATRLHQEWRLRVL
ncbi:hypothetical protein [Corynebacterium accolens]|uniref:hypothetical protein n=1 Tax=Corynebacterium accolens TaxID=38284 RepID=UPI00201E4C59|nr:hypothetical protein [Corynebacterium accolens]UQZ27907.1 hypothetical protein CACC_06040 [Corynebacterium accolens]